MFPLTTEIFINRSQKIHKGFYGYSDVIYQGRLSEVLIHCPKHGDFTQKPTYHLRGAGCPQCGILRIKEKGYTTMSYLKRAREVHGDTYDYSQVQYTKSICKIKVLCRKHGVFLVRADAHLNRGTGCAICAGKSPLTYGTFTSKASIIHKDFYSYPPQGFIPTDGKVLIICPKHGEFCQGVHSHLSGRGCPRCFSSKGEKRIESYLLEKGYAFQRQAKLPGCRYLRQLRVDFYLPSLNLFIEFNGRQHYSPVQFKGKSMQASLRDFTCQQVRDSVKREYITRVRGTLLEIPFKDLCRIPEVLNKFFGEMKQ